MAVVNATVHSVKSYRVDDLDPLQSAMILVFLPPGETYAQADGIKIVDAAGAIQNSRHNGRTVTLLDACLYQAGRKDADADYMFGANTVAVSGSDVTFKATLAATAKTLDVSTALANGAIPEQVVPLGILVTFTES